MHGSVMTSRDLQRRDAGHDARRAGQPAPAEAFLEEQRADERREQRPTSSRSAATAAIGARVIAHSTMAYAPMLAAPPSRPRRQRRTM